MIVIDDFIKDQSLLDEIANDESFFGDNGNFMWWDGWWNSPANTLKKRIIELIWKDHPLAKYAKGFEYWTWKMGANQNTDDLDLHMDKDELAWDTHQKFLPALMGCIYYPLDVPFEGGFLQLQSQNNTTEVLSAKYNRLIMFETGQIEHGVSKVYSGVRHSLAINLFNEELEAVKQGTITIEK